MQFHLPFHHLCICRNTTYLPIFGIDTIINLIILLYPLFTPFSPNTLVCCLISFCKSFCISILRRYMFLTILYFLRYLLFARTVILHICFLFSFIFICNNCNACASLIILLVLHVFTVIKRCKRIVCADVFYSLSLFISYVAGE
ncbi:hypothetical protein RDI58_007129 [Solanum bulbocastanum]|uniref:Uncharacterized protein n=1 Tax=Solanum bulbocastanum TaxID=147425 RepID=A0AAN8YIX5_SOLBU